MESTRTRGGLLRAAGRWMLDELGTSLLALAILGGAWLLTDRAGGSPWRTLLYLTPPTGLLVLGLVRRSSRDRGAGDGGSGGG